MWNDEDNNPYGSFNRRDSDLSQATSPTSRFARPSTPPSGTSSPPNEHADPQAQVIDVSDDGRQDGSTEEAPGKKGGYASRVERLLYENQGLSIAIIHAGKNQEGGGSYIAYTIRFGDIEVRRRYSDFYSLRQTLVNLHPTLIIPPIPEKHSVADYAAKPTKAKEDEAIIDHRKRMLASFLNRCRKLKDVREDGVFWKFLDPHASWSEVLHSYPVSSLPKNNLKAPPLDPANPTAGHNYLPIPSSSAKLKSSKDQTASGTPTSPTPVSAISSAASHTTSGPQVFGKFPSSAAQLSEADLDPYFVNFEASSRELEGILQGNIEKVNRRTLSHLNLYSEDLAELGARLNGFSLSEQSSTLAAAIEKVGQAVDSTYMATGEVSSSLSAGFSEPMRESAQFAGIVRSVLRYRILKRVQEEMTRDELDKKRTSLAQLEQSELEAKRIEQHLESSGLGLSGPPPKRSFSSSSTRSDRQRSEEDTASIDSDFPSGQGTPSATQGAPQPRSEPTSPTGTHKKSSSGNFVTNKIFGRINYAIHGMVDVDPERTRRDQIGKTKESLVQLEQALEVSTKDVRDASAGVMKSLKGFQSEKEDDFRNYMISYAQSHIAWAKKNLTAWEEAKTEVESIQVHVFLGQPGHIDHLNLILWSCRSRQLLAKTSYPKKRKLATYTRRGSSSREAYDQSIFGADEDNASGLASPTSSPRPSPSPAPQSASPTTPRFIPPHLQHEVRDAYTAPDFVSRGFGHSAHDRSPSFGSKSPSARAMTGSNAFPRDDTAPESGRDSPSSTSAAGTDTRSMKLGLGVRSSSPAKRSASERDSDNMDVDVSAAAMRSPVKDSGRQQHQSPMPNRSKPFTQAKENHRPSSDVPPDNTTSASESTADTTMRSSPPTSTDDEATKSSSAPSYDEQYARVRPMVDDQEMKEGLKGYIVPMSWLARVISRTTEGLKDAQYPKSAREGSVGPIDMRELVPSTAASDLRGLKDGAGHDFIPLKPGLRFGEDFQVFPEQAWSLIKEWHGVAAGSPVITRFAHNTNPDAEGVPNFQYEMYPPVVTIQKVSNANESMGRGLETIRDAQAPAARMITSRSELYQNFLRRAKQAAGIDMNTKVQVWKVVEMLEAHTGRAGIPTPVSSRSASPVPRLAPLTEASNLTIDIDTLTSMAEGTQRELIESRDETANEKYNGHVTTGTIGFSEVQTLILEEQVRNISREEYRSSKARTATASASANGTANQNKTTALADNSAKSALAKTQRRSPTPSGRVTRGRDNKGRVRGSVGLNNLGNTCYMNSALQCVRSIEELTIYFLREMYTEELNPSNPLGHRGAVAKAYAGLVAQIYSSTSSFAPRNFKATLGRCQPTFSGYGQQDSQEFVSFLLDGLHEDLNRIHKKPYIENPDSDDKTVHDPQAIKELGETFRNNNRRRNDSVVMDLFSGFYKNTIVCPECGKVSITFDPFSQVTLQLPVENTWQHSITIAARNGPPVVINVDIDKNSSIKNLKEYVAKRIPAIDADDLVMAEEYNQKFYKLFEDAEVLSESSIQQGDKLWMFELDASPTNWPPVDKFRPKVKDFLSLSSSSTSIPPMSSHHADRMAIPLLHRIQLNNGRKMTLWPSFILVTRDEAKDFDKILRKVLQRVDTMTTRDMFDDEIDAVADGSAAAESDHLAEDGDTQHVQARSIEGEDDVVDVSMSNTGDAVKEQPHPKSKQPNVLDPKYYIEQEYRNLFDICIYTGSNDIVPTGWSSISDNTKYPMLGERLAKSGGRRMSTSSWSSRRSMSRGHRLAGRATPSESEDELASDDITYGNSMEQSQTPSLSVENSDDDLSNTETNGSPAPAGRSGKHGGAQFQKIKQYGRSFANSMRRSRSRGLSDEDYLIRLGELLILDWNSEGFEQLFGGEGSDAMRGQRSDENKAIVSDPELEARKARRADRKSKGVTLEECFTETAKSEVLSQENAWYCGKCKEHRRASKTLELWTVPDILVVHLKRFSSQSRLRDKVDILVDFPIEGLDLSGKVGISEDKSLIYDLFAVDNHYGGLGGGHYTAYAQNFYDKVWYDYNDSIVSKTSSRNVVSKAAYLLFYRRRSDAPLGPPYLQELVLKDEKGASDSSSSSPAGKELPSGRARSPSGSSEGSSAAPAPGVSRGFRVGSNSLQSAEQPSDYDEAISMEAGPEMDPDTALPGLEDQSSRPLGLLGQRSSWSFGNLNKGTAAPPGSADMGDADSDANTLAESDGVAAGSSPDARMLDDFSQGEPLSGQMAEMPPSPEPERVDYTSGMHIEHVEMGGVNSGLDEDDVAEIHISQDEKA